METQTDKNMDTVLLTSVIICIRIRSLVLRDCLPRLVDATLCADGPEALLPQFLAFCALVSHALRLACYPHAGNLK